MQSQFEQKFIGSADLLDIEAAAAFLDVSPGTLGVWRSTGRYNLPFLEIGSKVRYRRADLEAWMQKRMRETGATAANAPGSSTGADQAVTTAPTAPQGGRGTRAGRGRPCEAVAAGGVA